MRVITEDRKNNVFKYGLAFIMAARDNDDDNNDDAGGLKKR